MSENPRIIVLGNRGHSKQIFHALLNREWNVVGAIGATDGQNRGQSGYASFREICERENIPLVETSDISDPEVNSLYAETEPDVCICCGWTQIIPESTLEAPMWGTVGLHLSPLPEGRGGAPVNWQIIHGHESVTATLFRFVPEVDHGDILGQTSVRLESRDDISTMYPKLTEVSIQLVHEFLTDLSAGTITRTSQSYDDATYYPQRKPQDGLIDWDRSPEFQWNWIRAQTHPYPGAFTFYNGQKLIIWDATLPDQQTESGKPGEILGIEPGKGIDVQSGNGTIRLQRIQFEGLPTFWADDAAIHHDLSTGTIRGHPRHFPEWVYTGIRDADGGFQYNTNMSLGNSVEILAVCCSHTTPVKVQINANFDG
jgi:methionyl-tRNA formyltransferase